MVGDEPSQAEMLWCHKESKATQEHMIQKTHALQSTDVDAFSAKLEERQKASIDEIRAEIIGFNDFCQEVW